MVCGAGSWIKWITGGGRDWIWDGVWNCSFQKGTFLRSFLKTRGIKSRTEICIKKQHLTRQGNNGDKRRTAYQENVGKVQERYAPETHGGYEEIPGSNRSCTYTYLTPIDIWSTTSLI